MPRTKDQIWEDGLKTGAFEAKRYLEEVQSDPDQQIAYEWLDRAISTEVSRLHRMQVEQAQIERWDISFRIMFLLMTLERRNPGMF